MDFQDPANRFLIIAGVGILVLIFFIIRANTGQGNSALSSPKAESQRGDKPKFADSSGSKPPPQKSNSQGQKKPYPKKPYNKGGGGGQQGGNRNYNKKKS